MSRRMLLVLLLSLICGFIPVVQASSQTVAGSWIVDAGYQTTIFRPGESVGAWTIVRNNFDNASILYAGFSVEDPNGIWFDAPYIVLVLQPSEVSAKVLFSWKVPEDAIPGSYSVKIAVWKGASENMLTERLDKIEARNVFTISRDLPPSAAIVNLAFFLILSVINFFMNRLRRIKRYKLVGYNGLLCFGYAFFLWNLPIMSFEKMVFEFVFILWGVLSVFVALNMDPRRKSESALSWVFGTQNSASAQIVLFGNYFLLPLIQPESTLSFRIVFLLIFGLLAFTLLNSPMIVEYLEKRKTQKRQGSE